MRVVLFCGGLGMRLREYSHVLPKPMVPIGRRPLVWHVMKHYAHHGYHDFVLCLGRGGEQVKDYFLDYDETRSNDFVLDRATGAVELLNRDADGWRITFVDTGTTTSIGQRLRAVEPHVVGEEVFLATYSDGLSDLDLRRYVADFAATEAVAALVAVRPRASFHLVDLDEAGALRRLRPLTEADLWVNGGYFAFRPEIFDYLEPGEDLVSGPLQRLAKEGRVMVHRHHGFWACVDTFKDQQEMAAMCADRPGPWEVWHGMAA